MGNGTATDTDRFKKVREDFYAKLGITDPNAKLGKKDSKALAKLAKAAATASDKADLAAHEKELKAAKDKVLYEDRRARSEATVSALHDYAPASNALISKFIDAQLKADAILKADGNAFEAANKALHDVSIKKALAQAESAWQKAEHEARKGKTTAPAYAKIDELRQSITAARSVLSDAALSPLRQRVLAAERTLLDPGQPAKALADATAQLNRIAADVADMDQKATSARAAADAARVLADRELAKLDQPDPLGPLITDADRALLQRMRTDADTAFGAREYTLAKSQFDDLVTRLKLLAAAATKDRTDWAQRSAEVDKMRTAARTFAGRATSPAVKESALALADQLDELAASKPGRDLAFKTALAMLDGARTALAGMLAEEKQFAAFAAERQAAAARIQKLDDQVEAAFKPLHAAVGATTQGKRPDLADGPFRERLQKTRDAWQARLATAQDKSTLDEAAAAAQLSGIQRALANAVRDSATLSRLIDGVLLQQAQQDYAKARAAAQAKAGPLTDIDALRGARVLAAMDTLHAKLDAKATPGAYRAAVAELGRLVQAVEVEAKSRQSQVSTLQAQLQTLLAPLPQQLDTMFAAVRKMSNADKQKPHLEMHATLVTALDGLRALGKLTQLPLLEEAIADAKRLGRDIGLSVAAATKGEPPDGGEVLSFGDARKRLAKLKDKLDDADVQTYARVSAFEAGETQQSLDKGLGSMTLSALEEALDALTTQVAKIERQAAAAKARFERFSKDELTPVQARLDAKPFKDAAAYAAAVKGRLQAVLADARFEGGLDDARAQLQKIVTELDDIVASGTDETGAPRALAAKENAALAVQRAGEVEKAKFKAEADVLEKQIAGLKGLYADDHKGLRDALDDAKRAADKGGQYADARDQLHGIRTRLALLAQNPHGLGIHVRKQLPSVNRRYKAAVAAYWGGLDAVEQAIAALPPADLPNTDKAVVRSTLGAVRVLYNPTAFDKPLAQVTNEGTPDNNRAAAREAALREVRRLGAYLNDDFRLQELADTPFHAPMRGLLSELRLALLDVENNLLVSM